MTVLLKIIQLIVALSVLVFIHELGHFLFSKMFGVRVDKFYLFFDTPNFRIFSTKRSRFVRKFLPRLADSKTDFGIGWIPLGGYCKIAGMIDESMDTDQLAHEPQSDEFRAQKPWKRFFILFGGVLNNFLLAIFLYIAILAIWGSGYVSNDDAQIYANDLAVEMGFRTGDHIISFDDYQPENFYMLQADLARQQTAVAKVLRAGDTLSLYLDHKYMPDVLNNPGMFDLAIPFVIDTVIADGVNGPDARCNGVFIPAGLARGDRIVAIDGIPTEFLQDSREILAERAGGRVLATVIRDSDTLSMDLAVDSLGHIGVYAKMPQVKTRQYNILEAIPAGVKLTFSTIGGYLKDLKLVATPSTGAYKSVGSFIAIGQIFPSAWDWYQFMNILALLSIMLAVMNLIPIPGLDGGHILFTFYEMVTGRKPSDRFLIVAQIIGMALLVMLMLLAFGNDIGRLLR